MKALRARLISRLGIARVAQIRVLYADRRSRTHFGFDAASLQETPATQRLKNRQAASGKEQKANPNRDRKCEPGAEKAGNGASAAKTRPYRVGVEGKRRRNASF
jgi:hypothetical protein